jgi:hypothetical protein
METAYPCIWRQTLLPLELTYKFFDDTCKPETSYRYRLDVSDEKSTRSLFITEESKARIPRLSLFQNYPNLFNPTTTIHFIIPREKLVTLGIFDSSGWLIVRLVDSVHKADMHEKEWSGCNNAGNTVSSVIYFIGSQRARRASRRKWY